MAAANQAWQNCRFWPKSGIGAGLLVLVGVAYFVVFYGDIASKIKAAEGQETQAPRRLGGRAQGGVRVPEGLAGADRSPAAPARAGKDPADHDRVSFVLELASGGRERCGREPDRVDSAARAGGEVLRARTDEARDSRQATIRSPSSSTASASSTASSTWRTSRSPIPKRTATSSWSRSRRSLRLSER